MPIKLSSCFDPSPSVCKILKISYMTVTGSVLVQE
uniref:Uncharacterized protein n=1 Tax=Amphimedon queenslandica TaxID=400682 RepID=A0A1X7V431_AMPQE